MKRSAIKFIGGDLSINEHLAAIYRQSWDGNLVVKIIAQKVGHSIPQCGHKLSIVLK